MKKSELGNCQIREVKIEDASAIWQLNSEEMGYEYSLADTIVNLSYLIHSENDKIFVALVNEKVVGYAHANTHYLIYAPHMKNIMGIAVASKYKRHGIGSALLLAIESWAKESGAKGIRLSSGATRTEAHEFYRQMGYGNEKKQINFKRLWR